MSAFRGKAVIAYNGLERLLMTQSGHRSL